MENDKIFLFVFRSNAYGRLADEITLQLRTFATVEPVSTSVVKCGTAGSTQSAHYKSTLPKVVPVQ